MPNRYVREDILDSDRVDALSAEAEVFYRRLMSKADDYGRFHGDWRKLRAALYPLRVEKITEKFIERLLVECNQVIDDRPLVHIYFHEGRRYLEITNFKQQIRSDSKFPNPNVVEKSSDRTCQSTDSICSQVSLNTDSDSVSSSNSNTEKTEEVSNSGKAIEIRPRSPLDESVDRNSRRIHGNHPPHRRDIGPGQAATKLRAIIRHKQLAGQAGADYLDSLADRHERCCASPDWTKEDGQYAKGLNNWLAPTIERYEQEPHGLLPARASPAADEPLPPQKPWSELFPA